MAKQFTTAAAAGIPPPDPKGDRFLINIASRHQVYLESYKTHVTNSFGPFLQEIAKSVDKRLLNKDLTRFNRERLEALLKLTQSDLKTVYGEYFDVWKEQIVDLAVYEAGFEVRSLQQVIDNYDFKLPSRTQLNIAVFSKPLSGIVGADKGALLPAFYKKWTNDTIDLVQGTIRAGYYQGLTTPQIVRQIKGTAAQGFTDGQLARGNKDISMLTRTAIQHASGEARNETWNANDDIVTGVRIVSTLDDRTTSICRDLDGREFPLNEGPRPPFHIGCRTGTVATFDSKFDVLDKGATRSAREPKAEGEKRGKVVSVPAKTTYYDWLKTQPPEFQDSVIGPTRGALLRDGGLSSRRFAELGLNKNFQPMDLKEMYKKEPLAFGRAGYGINDKGNIIKK